MKQTSYQQLINRISTGYQQDINKNQNLKLGADFRIFKMTPQYIPPFEKPLGYRGYTPLGFKGAYMLGTKNFLGV